MLDFVQKRKVKSVMYHKATLGVLGLVVLFAMHSTWSVYQKKAESEDGKTLAQERVEELRARDRELQAKIERLNTVAGVEEEIRSKFSVAKENEALVIVVEDEESQASSSSQKESFWASIRSFFTK